MESQHRYTKLYKKKKHELVIGGCDCLVYHNKSVYLQKEILAMNATSFLEKVPMTTIVNLLLPLQLLEPFQNAVAHRSLLVSTQVRGRSEIPFFS